LKEQVSATELAGRNGRTPPPRNLVKTGKVVGKEG